ncbi:MAG: hypothetical protein KGH89_08230 [Thaumarchaeota archaeon]|nr:hypothetical protein [Nitrososphaerota archaeon]
MEREDRAKVDQAKDNMQKRISELNEIIAGYGLESRNATDPEIKRRADVDSGILKQVVVLYNLVSQMGDQMNKHAVTIINLRTEIEQLKAEIESLKK